MCPGSPPLFPGSSPGRLQPGGACRARRCPRATMPLTPQMTQQIQKLPPQRRVVPGKATQPGPGRPSPRPAGPGPAWRPDQARTGAAGCSGQPGQFKPGTHTGPVPVQPGAQTKPGQVQPGVPTQPGQVHPGVPPAGKAKPGEFHPGVRPSGTTPGKTPTTTDGSRGCQAQRWAPGNA